MKVVTVSPLTFTVPLAPPVLKVLPGAGLLLVTYLNPGAVSKPYQGTGTVGGTHQSRDYFMKERFSRIGVSSALLFFFFLSGCGGGGGGGGSNNVSGSVNGNGNKSISQNPAPVETPAPTGEIPAPVDTAAPVNEPANPIVSTGPDSRADSSTIAWLPPTENADDSAFTDPVGYKIYIGSAPGRYEIVRALQDPGLTEYVIEDVPPGTYYVAMTSVNSKNIESPLSNVVVKVVGGG